MIKPNTLKDSRGKKKQKVRIGRGSGTGKGGTSGRGDNGSRARSGYKSKIYFEGGQLPLIRRIPKRGFKSKAKKEYQIVNLMDIESCDVEKGVVDKDLLFEKRLIPNKDGLVKILGNGELTKKLSIVADAFSESAKTKILKAEGEVKIANS